ncbi:MAG: alpha/beta hydrolase [Anaerocolumna sp.]|jgi:pimeloyl-ACP methyl ester carboxylesterase|nr:alpha/beta hydrolase [Anaerocolumna sp.]
MAIRLNKKRNIILILLFFLILGTLWQGIMLRIENKRYSTTGIHINTGSYKASCYVKGEGGTAFVFITGSGTPSAYTDFYYLQDELSKYGQTISFDHAGFGWSSNTKIKRDIDSLVQELSVIVDTLVSGNRPIILVCHSLGALEAIRFTQMNQERVAGIIFLDGGSPQYYSTASEMSSIVLNRTSAILRVSGINRLLGELGTLLPLYGENIRNAWLTTTQKEIDKVMYYKYMGTGVNIKNLKLMNENAKTVLDKGKLGSTPILLLSSDSGKEWSQVQEQLSIWSTNSKQIKINGADHYLHWTNYKEVVENIESFVTSIGVLP